MWDASVDDLEPGRVRRFVLRRDGMRLRYSDVLALWQGDGAFRSFFLSLLAAAPFEAFFWECPPISAANADRTFEFVLVDCPALANLPPDPHAFARHCPGAPNGIATFWNLGRDARLVAPCPQAPLAVYPHIAAFARGAPEAQQHALWRAVGSEVERQLSARPLWLSTSGLGVAWLHVRLDSQPKYYSFGPYRAAD
jgi:hypothetical protein